MKWMQFFTRVNSITWDEANELAANHSDNVIFLDVRQPKEYAARHLPGAKLLPLGELDDRLDELSRDKPTVIY
jgi:rhodanese-related sulfurtransferase